MKSPVKYLITAGLIVLLVGCGGTFQPPSTSEKADEAQFAKTKDKYQPLGLPEDLVIVPSAISVVTVNDSLSAGKNDLNSSLSPIDDTNQPSDQAFRIQLFTSKEYGPAFREKTIATEVFDQPVLMDYEVPYYKVRVGNFATQEEAEKYLPAAREAGYKTAWVVRAYLNVRTIEDIYDGYNEEIFNPATDSLYQMEIETDSVQGDYDYQEN